MNKLFALALCGGLAVSACQAAGPLAPEVIPDPPPQVRVVTDKYDTGSVRVAVSWGRCDHAHKIAPGSEFSWPPEGAEDLRFCVGYAIPLHRTDLGTFHASGILVPDPLERAVADSALFFFRRASAPLKSLEPTVVEGVFSTSHDYAPSDTATLVLLWPVTCTQATGLEEFTPVDGLQIQELNWPYDGIITFYLGLPTIKLACPDALPW